MNKKKKLITGIIAFSTIGFLGIAGVYQKARFKEWYLVKKFAGCTEFSNNDCAEVLHELRELGSIVAVKWTLDLYTDSLETAAFWIAYEDKQGINLSVQFNEYGSVFDFERGDNAFVKKVRKSKPTEVDAILKAWLKAENQSMKAVAASILFDDKSDAIKYIPSERWQDRKKFFKIGGFKHFSK